MAPLVWAGESRPARFTAAEFALEMVAAASAVSFRITQPLSDGSTT
jgi:hypothetical protein